MKQLFIHNSNSKIEKYKILINGLFVFVILSLFTLFAFSKLEYTFNWEPILRYRYKFFQGWTTTLLISFISLIVSLSIGLITAILNRSKIIILNMLIKVYINLIRSTPLLVQILIFFYVFASALGIENRYLVGILTLSIFSGAYISEIIRGGIESISESQIESARAIGLSTYQTYIYIIIPQVTKQILPALAGQFVSLIKDSSLLSIIAIQEFTLSAQEVNSYTYSTLESYLPLALGYFMVTMPISLLSNYLEEKTRYES